MPPIGICLTDLVWRHRQRMWGQTNISLVRIMLNLQEAGASKLTVLYIEDNADNLALVELLIARRGDLTMLSAVDGPLGIELARARQPDVILMDINLPGMNGFDVLKCLRADPATAHIPVMALSSDAYPKQIEKGLNAGFFQYLTKPFKFKEFEDSLDLCLQSAVQNRLTA
jgi:CheY-like chemotaxis protein